MIENYEHNHVLRSSVNSTWGESIEFTDSIIYKSYDLTNPNNINDISNCSIIAYVYDEETKEIIQASKKILIHSYNYKLRFIYLYFFPFCLFLKF